LLEFHVQNLYTRVNKKKAGKEELTELHNILSVKVPGHYFSPHFRRGMWDGYKRFFNLLTGSFYTGLLGYAKSHLSENIEISEVDERAAIPHQNNPLGLNGIKLRDYQVKMVAGAISKGRGIISAPPNAGKTEVAAGIVKVLGLPAIFFTHRLTLLHQTQERFSNRLEIEVGLVGGGKDDWITDGVNIVSIQTAYKKLDSFEDRVKEIPIVIADECHHLSSRSFEKLLKLCKDSYFKFGLSATPLLRDDVSNMTVRGLLGDEIVSVTNQELIAAGISAFPSVYLLNVQEPKISDHFTFDQAYESGILYNSFRNGLVVSSAERFLKQDKSVFILVWRIAHGEVLRDLFLEKGVNVEFISGQEKPEYIKSTLEDFSKKKLKCVISSTISDEGMDIPAVDVLILAVGFKAPLKTIQRVGRGLRRKTSGENVVSIVDFVDWQSKRYLYKHSVDRVREYVKMGIKIYEVVGGDWERIEER